MNEFSQPEFLIFISIAFAAVAVGSFIKGVTGVGLPLVSVPILAAVLGVEHAVTIMVVPSFAANLGVVWAYRDQRTANRDLITIILTGVVGVVGGAWALTRLGNETLFVLLAAWIGGYLRFRAGSPKTELTERANRVVAPVVGFAAGGFQGVTGISFPIFGPYLHSRGLTPRRFAFNAAAFLLAISSVQIIAFQQLGLFSGTRFFEGLVALVPMGLVLPLGIRASKHVSRGVFDKLVIVLLAATALILAARGLIVLEI